MKKNFTLFKVLLVAIGLLGGVSAWAQDIIVPTPVYFNDFSFAESGKEDIEIVGSGAFETDDDARFGKFYHNDPNLTKAVRTNYLKLPASVLTHSGTTKEMTIGFWVNAKNAEDFWGSPIFTAYETSANAASAESWPMFAAWSGGTLQANCWGWTNFDGAQNDNSTKTNAYDTFWMDDKEWHYFTITLTTTKAVVYIDGVVKNSWTEDGTDGHCIKGIFEGGAANALAYVCLGGNQPWNQSQIDPAFGFDDFAVYNVALSKAQIDQIRANKLNRTVTGTQIGAMDNSTEYLAATSEKVTLKPGESYHYSFVNYNGGGINNWNNWVLPVYDINDNCVITVRADNYEDKYASNAGCTSNFNWTNFPANLNGAKYDMTVTYTNDKKFNMSSTITTVDNSTWNYSYKTDYNGSTIDLTPNDYIKVALSVSRSWLDLTNEGYSAIAVSVSDYGYATLCPSYNLDFSSVEGIEACKAEVADGKITYTKVNTVAAGEGVLLRSTAGGAATVSVPVIASATANADNAFVGIPEKVQLAQSTEAGYTNYILSVVNNEFGFYKVNSNGSWVKAGSAYLKVANTSAANLRGFIPVVDSDVTGIDNIKAEKAENGAAYNMAGQRVDGSYKGIVIKNGKKVFVR